MMSSEEDSTECFGLYGEKLLLKKLKRNRQRVDAGEPRNSYSSIPNFSSRPSFMSSGSGGIYGALLSQTQSNFGGIFGPNGFGSAKMLNELFGRQVKQAQDANGPIDINNMLSASVESSATGTDLINELVDGLVNNTQQKHLNNNNTNNLNINQSGINCNSSGGGGGGFETASANSSPLIRRTSSSGIDTDGGGVTPPQTNQQQRDQKNSELAHHMLRNILQGKKDLIALDQELRSVLNNHNNSNGLNNNSVNNNNNNNNNQCNIMDLERPCSENNNCISKNNNNNNNITNNNNINNNNNNNNNKQVNANTNNNNNCSNNLNNKLNNGICLGDNLSIKSEHSLSNGNPIINNCVNNNSTNANNTNNKINLDENLSNNDGGNQSCDDKSNNNNDDQSQHQQQKNNDPPPLGDGCITKKEAEDLMDEEEMMAISSRSELESLPSPSGSDLMDSKDELETELENDVVATTNQRRILRQQNCEKSLQHEPVALDMKRARVENIVSTMRSSPSLGGQIQVNGCKKRKFYQPQQHDNSAMERYAAVAAGLNLGLNFQSLMLDEDDEDDIESPQIQQKRVEKNALKSQLRSMQEQLAEMQQKYVQLCSRMEQESECQEIDDQSGVESIDQDDNPVDVSPSPPAPVVPEKIPTPPRISPRKDLPNKPPNISNPDNTPNMITQMMTKMMTNKLHNPLTGHPHLPQPFNGAHPLLQHIQHAGLPADHPMQNPHLNHQTISNAAAMYLGQKFFLEQEARMAKEAVEHHERQQQQEQQNAQQQQENQQRHLQQREQQHAEQQMRKHLPSPSQLHHHQQMSLQNSQSQIPKLSIVQSDLSEKLHLMRTGSNSVGPMSGSDLEGLADILKSEITASLSTLVDSIVTRFVHQRRFLGKQSEAAAAAAEQLNKDLLMASQLLDRKSPRTKVAGDRTSSNNSAANRNLAGNQSGNAITNMPHLNSNNNMNSNNNLNHSQNNLLTNIPNCNNNNTNNNINISNNMGNNNNFPPGMVLPMHPNIHGPHPPPPDSIVNNLNNLPPHVRPSPTAAMFQPPKPPQGMNPVAAAAIYNSMNALNNHSNSQVNPFCMPESREPPSSQEQNEALSLVVKPKKKRHKVTDTRITPRTVSRILAQDGIMPQSQQNHLDTANMQNNNQNMHFSNNNNNSNINNSNNNNNNNINMNNINNNNNNNNNNNHNNNNNNISNNNTNNINNGNNNNNINSNNPNSISRNSPLTNGPLAASTPSESPSPRGNYHPSPQQPMLPVSLPTSVAIPNPSLHESKVFSPYSPFFNPHGPHNGPHVGQQSHLMKLSSSPPGLGNMMDTRDSPPLPHPPAMLHPALLAAAHHGNSPDYSHLRAAMDNQDRNSDCNSGDMSFDGMQSTLSFSKLRSLNSDSLTPLHSSTLTPMHLRKAKLMFFWVRYPSSAVLKMYFPDIKFNKNNTAQLVKWFSNFREFYYIQMEKYARQAVTEGATRAEELYVSGDSELYRVLNLHYNRNNHIVVPDNFRVVVEQTLREFFRAIQGGKDTEQSWKKSIYKIISRLDDAVPEYFKSPNFLETLE